MINFRYHVVSIVAVFLALALGMVMGTTVIQKGLLSQLQKDLRDFRSRNGTLRSQLDAIDAQIASWQKFGATILPPLVKGKLSGKSVTLMIEDGAPKETVDRVREALILAGAPKSSTIALTAAWRLEEKDRVALSSALNSTATDLNTLTQSAATAVADRLLSPADLNSPKDLLVKLRDLGFIRLQDLPAGAAFPAPSAFLVVIPAGAADAVPAQDAFFLTLLRAIEEKKTVAVAETMNSADSLARRVQDDPTVRKRVATIDHADQTPGELSLVWALRTLALTGVAEHFGTQSGSDGIAPGTLQ